MAEELEYTTADGVKVNISFVSPPERGPHCETCRFYLGAREESGESGQWRSVPYGQCKRVPPRASTNRREFAFWPKVLADDWCGEYKTKAEAETDG